MEFRNGMVKCVVRCCHGGEGADGLIRTASALSVAMPRASREELESRRELTTF